jgi:hypothetical protein
MGSIENRKNVNVHGEVHIQRKVLRKIEERSKTNNISEVKVKDNYNWKCCQRLLRAIAFFVFLGLLIYEAVEGFTHFLDFPTYTSTQIVPQRNAEFPALSICPMTNGYKDEVLKVN